MNAGIKTLACAFSNKAVIWHEIDWSQAHRNVQRLQAHIVKATYLQRCRVRVSRAFEGLEPCMEKFIRTVLRGLGGSNAPWLPGHVFPQKT